VVGQARIAATPSSGSTPRSNGITVGEYSIVGAAALVSRTPAALGHPARSAELRYSSDEYAKHVEF
jgi:hypothetical protein